MHHAAQQSVRLFAVCFCDFRGFIQVLFVVVVVVVGFEAGSDHEGNGEAGEAGAPDEGACVDACACEAVCA